MTGGILAVRQDSLGDVLLAGPALRALAAGSDGPLTLLCGPRGESAARLLPGVDEVLVHLAPWIDPEPPSIDADECQALIDAVSARSPAQAVIFTSFHQSPLPLALLLRLAGVSRIAAISSDYPGSLLDVRHRVPDDLHEVQRALSLAEAAGFEPPDDDDHLLRVNVHAQPPRLPQRPFVVVHPGASVPARAWEPDGWAAVVEILADRGRRVVVTGAAFETTLTSLVAGNTAGVLDLGGGCSLAQLAAVFAEAEAVAVANTGPAHLAAAMGTPVVSLFAPTVPWARWRPWGVPAVQLNQRVVCPASCGVSCHVPGHPCLRNVDPIDVATCLDGFLDESGVATPEGAAL